jgi:hypothetical protein
MILWCIGGTMRLKKHKTTGSNDLFRARLDQIINMKPQRDQREDDPDRGRRDRHSCAT